MSKTRIFVSSTCFDLAAIREDIRRFIGSLGHEPLLSEYSSFPVNPDSKAIVNCKNNVSNHTDLLILIVGGRRGSVDSESGKSVTNLEYQEARRAGIPCFVFIKRDVLNLLHIWKKNPDADFTSAVDYPDVFRFIDNIQSDNQWMFPFERLEEIEEHLGFQLTVMLRDLLDRKRAGKLDLIASYAVESQEAQRLARDRPRYWEHLLTAELIKTKFAEVRRRYCRLKSGATYVQSKCVDAIGFIDWARGKTEDIVSLIQSLQEQIPLVQASWGPIGQPGDVIKIQQSVNEFIELCFQLVQWEADVRSVIPPEAAKPLKKAMEGWTELILDELERLPEELLRPFKDAANPKGTIEIMLTIKLPPGIQKFVEEIDNWRKILNPFGL